MKLTKKKMAVVITSILICAVYFLFFGPRSYKVVALQVSDGAAIFSGPSGYRYECRMDEIQSIKLLDALDPGTLVTGEDFKDYRYGTWENEDYGTYELCASKAFDCWIELKTEKGTFVFNYENKNHTQVLYQSFLEKLEE